MAEERSVEPGQELAYSEEGLPGKNTYDDGEQIRAAAYGTMAIDPDNFEIRVDPAGKSVSQIEKGDIVIGQIRFMKPDLASVEIIAVRGKGGSILQQTEGTLRVRNADDRYVSELGDIMRVGDLIRAKVLDTRGGPQLATDRDEFGVVKAFSRLDPKRALVCDGRRLLDPETGHQETRKIASDYGSGVI